MCTKSFIWKEQRCTFLFFVFDKYLWNVGNHGRTIPMLWSLKTWNEKTPSGTLHATWNDNHLKWSGQCSLSCLKGTEGWVESHECHAISDQRLRACQCWCHFKSPNNCLIQLTGHIWLFSTVVPADIFLWLRIGTWALYSTKGSQTYHQHWWEKDHWLSSTKLFSTE